MTGSRPFGRLISLSHIHDPATAPLFPGDPEFRTDIVATVANDSYYLRYIQQGEHTSAVRCTAVGPVRPQRYSRSCLRIASARLRHNRWAAYYAPP